MFGLRFCIRTNNVYRPHVCIDQRGLLIVTTRRIYAFGAFAYAWRL